MNSSTNTVSEAALYVVATPIGNLEDFTPRALQVLTSVALIAAEDTRNARKLLRQWPSGARLIAAHMHNEREAAEQILSALAAGESCALICDAGTPAISDPGARVVQNVQEAGFCVVPIPGPCAATTLLSAAGIDAGRFGDAANRFFYAGFLSSKSGLRDRTLERYKRLDEAVVIYEAPHRIDATLAAIADVFGADRWLVIGRELTKKFEQIHACNAADMLEWLRADSNHGRGEFVVLIAPPPRSDGAKTPEAAILADDMLKIETSIGQLLAELMKNMSASRAAKSAGAITGLPHRDLYRLAAEISSSRSSGADN